MDIEISQIVIPIVVIVLFLWRMSDGARNGLFGEAAGLIAVIAAFVAVYFIANIAGNVLNRNFGAIAVKIGYLIVAVVVYRVMAALYNALKKIKDIPVLGALDRVMGAVFGAAEAAIIIYIVEFVTGISFFDPVIALFTQGYNYLNEKIQNLF